MFGNPTVFTMVSTEIHPDIRLVSTWLTGA